MERNIGGLLSKMLQRITLLERRQARRSTGAGVGVPYGVPLPFLGPDELIPDRYVKPVGQTVSRVTYANLFAAFGTLYGAGDGSTTFRLPDLRERALVGVSPGSAEFGTVGATYGTKTHTLTSAQIPNLTASTAGVHNHPIGGLGRFVTTNRSTDAGKRAAPATTTGDHVPAYNNAQDVGSEATTANAGGHSHPVNTGGGGAHNNLPPSLACNWILKY